MKGYTSAGKLMEGALKASLTKKAAKNAKAASTDPASVMRMPKSRMPKPGKAAKGKC
jgi:hypothetical protein